MSFYIFLRFSQLRWNTKTTTDESRLKIWNSEKEKEAGLGTHHSDNLEEIFNLTLKTNL